MIGNEKGAICLGLRGWTDHLVKGKWTRSPLLHARNYWVPQALSPQGLVPALSSSRRTTSTSRTSERSGALSQEAEETTCTRIVQRA